MSTSRARDRLNPEAKFILRLHGISAVGWARWCNNGDEQWYGDACGCTDDRCADERWHHRPQDPCGCLYALLELYHRDPRSYNDAVTAEAEMWKARRAEAGPTPGHGATMSEDVEPLACTTCGCTDAERCDPWCEGMLGPGECDRCLTFLSPSEVTP